MKNIDLKAFIVPIIILIVFIGGVLGIVNWQKQSKNVPQVTLNMPDEKIDTIEAEILVSGKTDSKNKVFINGEEVNVPPSGEFSKTVVLAPGENKIEVKAENSDRQTVILTRTVTKIVETPTEITSTTIETISPVTETETAPATESLNSSGPEDLLWVVGFGLLSIAGYWYARSRKIFSHSLRKM